MRIKKADLYICIKEGLIAMVALTWVKYENILIKNVTTPRKSAEQKQKDDLIWSTRCWDQLDRGEYNVATFLQEVSYFEEEEGRSNVPEPAGKSNLPNKNCCNV